MYPLLHEIHEYPSPSLPFIYGQFSHLPAHYTSANWHTNIELFYIRSGRGYVLYDSREIPVTAGDTVVISANGLHNCRSDAETAEPFSYDYLILDREFCIQNGVDSAARYFAPHFRDDTVPRLLDVFATHWSEEPLGHIVPLRAAALALLALILQKENAPADRPPESAVPDKNHHIKRAITYMEEHLSDPMSLSSLAEVVGVSRCHLAHIFQEATGLSVVHYLQILRCRHANLLLQDSNLPIAEIAVACGFGSVSYFDRCFRRHFGLSPRQMRERDSK